MEVLHLAGALMEHFVEAFELKEAIAIEGLAKLIWKKPLKKRKEESKSLSTLSD